MRVRRPAQASDDQDDASARAAASRARPRRACSRTRYQKRLSPPERTTCALESGLGIDKLVRCSHRASPLALGEVPRCVGSTYCLLLRDANCPSLPIWRREQKDTPVGPCIPPWAQRCGPRYSVQRNSLSQRRLREVSKNLEGVFVDRISRDQRRRSRQGIEMTKNRRAIRGTRAILRCRGRARRASGGAVKEHEPMSKAALKSGVSIKTRF